MATSPQPGTPGVRALTLDAGGIPLSGLLALPAQPVPRAVVVALHGAGMSAGYFDSRARPGLSLLELGASLGYTVLSLDRPGYGASAAALPEGQELAGQTETLLAALEDFARGHELGAGYFLVAHSNGGRLALSAAGAGGGFAPLGVDLCGLGRRFAVDLQQLPGAADLRGQWRRHWGRCASTPGRLPAGRGTDPSGAGPGGPGDHALAGRVSRRRGPGGGSGPLHLRGTGAVVEDRRRGSGGTPESAVPGRGGRPPARFRP